MLHLNRSTKHPCDIHFIFCCGALNFLTMKALKKLRRNYIEYLIQNPKSYKYLKDSCEFLHITEKDFA